MRLSNLRTKYDLPIGLAVAVYALGILVASMVITVLIATT